MFEQELEFQANGQRVEIDIGYHSTRRQNMSGTRKFGLLTRAELEQHGIVVEFNGEAHGPGIYTSRSHLGEYGSAGILVLRLMILDPNIHTSETVVLRASSQVTSVPPS